MNREVRIAGLLRQANFASTLAEKTEFVRQAEELKNEAIEARRSSSSWSAEDAVINDILVPGRVHELHTAATDWIVDLDTSFDQKQATQKMIAEASLWYGRVSDDVKSYGEEYAEQARNLARRLAGSYGDGAEIAERAFLDETARLRATALRSGIIVEADLDSDTPWVPTKEQRLQFKADLATGAPSAPAPSAKPDDDPAGTGGTDKDMSGLTPATAATEDDKDDDDDDRPARWRQMNAKDREDWLDAHSHDKEHYSSMHSSAGFDLVASLEAIEAASGLPEVTQQGYPTDVFSNLSQNGNVPPEETSSNRAPAFRELNDTSGDVVPVNDPGLGQVNDLTGANKNPNATEDYASKGTFPVSGNKKESTMAYATCRTCGGHGKVAVKAKEAASGLPQIDQIVDPNNAPSTTAYPADVAFPWTLNPSQQIPAAIQQAEQQIAERETRKGASRRHAGGRDNSGWIGDQGARGVDYPGEQFGQPVPPGNNLGAPNPVYQYGGDKPNQPNLPYGHAEEADYTNNPGQNWQPGQPTQADQGAAEATEVARTQAAWNHAVASNPNLQAALDFVEQHRQAVLRSGR